MPDPETNDKFHLSISGNEGRFYLYFCGQRIRSIYSATMPILMSPALCVFKKCAHVFLKVWFV